MALPAPGHEFTGTMVETGKGITIVRANDRVGVEPLFRSRQCGNCKQGLPHLCARIGFLGRRAAPARWGWLLAGPLITKG